jgi:hypothetical protein
MLNKAKNMKINFIKKIQYLMSFDTIKHIKNFEK